MTTPFHTTVSLEGFHFEDSIFTFNLKAGITAADVGKPVSLDKTANNTVQIAPDGARIIGKLASVESRNGGLVGAVEMDFTARWTIKAADTLAVGDMVVGAGAGQVRKWATNDELDYLSLVVEVSNGTAVVMSI